MTPTPEQLQAALKFNQRDIDDCQLLIDSRVKAEESKESMANLLTIQFALRFTAKALGEPSDRVLMAGAESGDCNSKQDAITIFNAQIYQLCKECAE